MSKHMLYTEEVIGDDDCEEITRLLESSFKPLDAKGWIGLIDDEMDSYYVTHSEDRAKQALRTILKLCLAGLYKK